MRVEQTDNGLNVYVRQSWIGDAMMCPERGRQGIIRSDWSMPNDATILGTAVHAGIAHILNGGSGGTTIGHETLNELLSEPFMRTKYSDEELHDHVRELIAEWERNIAHEVKGVVAVEKEFEFLLDEFHEPSINQNVKVYGKGTIDLVTETEVWDWKTAGRKYNAREKQSQAVQPTMYASAAVAMGWLEFPVTFKYGVMVRSGKAQIVSVHRNESHTEWLREIVRPFVRSTILLGTDSSWPKNDTHYLCSETWCSWWSICKGSKLSPCDINPEGNQ